MNLPGMIISAQKKTPSVNRGNLVAELTTMQSIGVTGGLKSFSFSLQLDKLLSCHKVF